MPNQYSRITNRGSWSQFDLSQAIDAVLKKNMSVRQAAFESGVPRKTLERRLKSCNYTKGPMGPTSVFGEKHEKRLVKHILNMQKHCFPLTPKDLRSIAFHFAEQLGIKHSFNIDKQESGYVWLQSFLRRNPEIRIRQSEGVSLARCEALNRSEVDAYFDTLYKLMEEYNLFDKPSKIFNMDETGLQLNTRPGQVLAKKGSKAVASSTSTEKGETITVVACCNAEGVFLPPACIMKGKNKKSEWQDGMPPGSVLYMNQKSAYINAHIFFEWLKTHFLPRKPPGTVLLILDGHASHCNSVEMLEFAAENDICLFTLPSHTTHYLQTLDRSVFKSLKLFYYEACRVWLKRNPGRRLTRLQFGELLSTAWSKAATFENATAGFRATGVYPFNRSAVPDYAFVGIDNKDDERGVQLDSSYVDLTRQGPSRIYPPRKSATGTPFLPEKDSNQPGLLEIHPTQKEGIALTPLLSEKANQPGPSGIQHVQNSGVDETASLLEENPCLFRIRSTSSTPSLPDSFSLITPTQLYENSSWYEDELNLIRLSEKSSIGEPNPSDLENQTNRQEEHLNDQPTKFCDSDAISLQHNTPTKQPEQSTSSAVQDNEETPSKFLNEISPIPIKVYKAKKRSKHVARVLTSQSHINHRKECEEKNKKKLEKKQEKLLKKSIKQEKQLNKRSNFIRAGSKVENQPAKKMIKK